jgi:hypothetical protein
MVGGKSEPSYGGGSPQHFHATGTIQAGKLAWVAAKKSPKSAPLMKR